jgi:hypothetical protein
MKAIAQALAWEAERFSQKIPCLVGDLPTIFNQMVKY